jgi:hypothetical protein
VLGRDFYKKIEGIPKGSTLKGETKKGGRNLIHLGISLLISCF